MDKDSEKQNTDFFQEKIKPWLLEKPIVKQLARIKSKIVAFFSDVLEQALIQVIVVVLIAFILQPYVLDYLTPKAELSVHLGKNADGYILQFNNETPFSGEDFYVALEGVQVDSVVGWLPPDRILCKSESLPDINSPIEKMVYCQYIPPNSVLSFQISISKPHFPNVEWENAENFTFIVFYWSKITKRTTLFCDFNSLKCENRGPIRADMIQTA